MNILFVHEVDWLNKVVFEIHSLSESLSLLDHQVYAIDYESMWVRNGLLDFGSFRTKEFRNVSRAYPGASVRLRRPGFIKIPGLSRLSAVSTHYLEIKRTIKQINIDAIVLYSVPTNGLQTVHLARKFGIPVLFRSIDALNQLVPYAALRPIVYFLERRVYHDVDLILTLTPRLSQYVINMGAPEAKVKLLPPGVDTNLFYPGFNCAKIKQRWEITDQNLVILFIGTLFNFSGLDIFVRLFPEVIKQIPEAKLLIVGDGPQRPKLERIIAELGLTKQIIITGFEPYETMPQYMNLASVCINPFLYTEATKDIIPTKVLQYLACGKGLVATALSGMMDLLPSKECGVIYAKGVDEMVAEVISLLKSPQDRQQLGQAGLNHVKQAHSYDKIARELEATLYDLIDVDRL